MVKVKIVTVLAVLAAVMLTSSSVQGAPQNYNSDGDIKIVKQNQIQDENSYKLEFENSDGQTRSEVGEVRGDEEGIVVAGQYSYDLGNKRYTVRYEAGKGGYRPTFTITDI